MNKRQRKKAAKKQEAFVRAETAQLKKSVIEFMKLVPDAPRLYPYQVVMLEAMASGARLKFHHGFGKTRTLLYGLDPRFVTVDELTPLEGK